MGTYLQKSLMWHPPSCTGVSSDPVLRIYFFLPSSLASCSLGSLKQHQILKWLLEPFRKLPFSTQLAADCVDCFLNPPFTSHGSELENANFLLKNATIFLSMKCLMPLPDDNTQQSTHGLCKLLLITHNYSHTIGLH